MFSRILCTLLALLFVAGCVSVPPTPTSRTITVTVPRIEPLPQTTSTQQLGGVSLTLAPVPFERQSVPGCSYGFATELVLGRQKTHQLLRETRFMRFDVSPPNLGLVLTVRNQMERVFKGAGAVVQFNVNGQVQGIDQSNYVEFINALIPPRGEQQIRIQGPRPSQLPEAATLGIFIYDVVTAYDAAGNVTNRNNFEWYFSVNSDVTSEQVTSTTRTVWIPNQDAALVMRRNPDGSGLKIDNPQHLCVGSAVAGR